MLKRFLEKIAILVCAALLVVKVGFLVLAVTALSSVAMWLGCELDNQIEPLRVSNYNIDFDAYLADHSVPLQAGEVARLRNRVFGKRYFTKTDDWVTSINRDGFWGSVTFALYERDGRDWLFVSPIAYKAFCHPLALVGGDRSLSHVFVDSQGMYYSDSGNRDYSWRFGERRALRSWQLDEVE